MGKAEHVGDYSPPTSVEHERMQGLRAMLRNAGTATLPRTMATRSNGGENRTLLRFIRARKGDTEKSFQMLHKSLQWRKDAGADDCLAKPLAPEHAKTLAAIPGFYVGHGKKGHPVFLDHTAVVPWDLILDKMGMKLFLYAQVQLLEWTNFVVYKDASTKYGRPITQGINIWDVKGLTLSKFTAKVREISSATSKIAQDNYPESLAAAYVINAPAIFKVIWVVISSFLDPRTVAKVHIYGSGPKAFAKLKNALGEDCFLTEEMVCCPLKQVGEAEKRMGLQSGMAASQSWIRDRYERNVKWWAEVGDDEDGTEGSQERSSEGLAGAHPEAPSTSRASGGLGRVIFSSTTDSVDGDEFFDAEADAFGYDSDGLDFDDPGEMDGDRSTNQYLAMPTPLNSTAESTPDSTVKLIDPQALSSELLQAREQAKDDLARGKKKCCGCC